jgi:DNA polymerase III epsilon subunit-like protein
MLFPGQYTKFNCLPNNLKNGEKVLILDTETTGIPGFVGRHFASYNRLKLYDSARLLQLSYAVFDYNFAGQLFSYKFHKNFYVKNNKLENTAIHINHISDETRETLGISVQQLYDEFEKDLSKVKAVICHGCDFDLNVLLSEAYRINHPVENILKEKLHFCTKFGDKYSVKINNKRFPNLNPHKLPLSEKVKPDIETYPFLKEIQAHNSLYDVFLTLELIKEKINIFSH